MIVVTACRVDERKFVGLFFWTWFVARSWTSVVEEKEFAGQSIGYCFTDLVAFWLVLVNDSLTVCYLYRNSGSKNRPKILVRWHLLTRFVFYYFILEPKYFLLVWLPILFF